MLDVLAQCHKKHSQNHYPENDITSRGYIALSKKQTNGNVYQLLLQSYVFFKKNTFVKIFLILNQNFPILCVIFL